MVSIIVASHGKLSEELIKSSEMIFGKQNNVFSVTFEPSENGDNLIEKYKKILKKLNLEDEVLFMVDLFGGSPYNAATRIAVENEKIDIITGVNLPMLLEAYSLRNTMGLNEIVSYLEKSSKEAIKPFKSGFKKIEEEL